MGLDGKLLYIYVCFMKNEKYKHNVAIANDLHVDLKVHCAKYNITMIDYVNWVIKEALDRQARPASKLTEVA